MPEKDESIEISLEWIEKIGIDSANLARRSEKRNHYAVQQGGTSVGWYDANLKMEMKVPSSIRLSFAQKIGDHTAYWHGMGGTVNVDAARGAITPPPDKTRE